MLMEEKNASYFTYKAGNWSRRQLFIGKRMVAILYFQIR